MTENESIVRTVLRHGFYLSETQSLLRRIDAFALANNGGGA